MELTRWEDEQSVAADRLVHRRRTIALVGVVELIVKGQAGGMAEDSAEYIVCWVAGSIFSRLAQPNPSSHKILPSLATATATDAVLVESRNRLIDARIGAKRSAV